MINLSCNFRGNSTTNIKWFIRLASNDNNQHMLLPPLKLYRRILRSHRNLSPVQKSIGDSYVKNEFRLHKNIDNPLHIVGFLTSWQDYWHIVSNGEWQEGTLSQQKLEKMSKEQVVQLYELMKEAQRLHDTVKTNDNPQNGK
ncbi:hypothetical protein KAFR_0D00410 [Kazachstania africana CBS 2517]|uniref:Succinate dehydrogenase assembly factor 3 n=1 Tax=Kazachstania africana (strain ATCC 22294 / BCRC 22015 / CBS 2517 / CECT 1963 / NBRC 1671 / NRRL Y-8276) TaxID=1071382 RepID=H2ATI8_KAZAF|nr:hypothetical protein KAFR_0D00410 [Kazachstania africana CBS 2517]CCF57688.1 hypothetical protein KAFR_0D00410 [Kazachstania africana CBS 2517]